METFKKLWTTIKKAPDACQDWEGGWWHIILQTVGLLHMRPQLCCTWSREGAQNRRSSSEQLVAYTCPRRHLQALNVRHLPFLTNLKTLAPGTCRLAKEMEQSWWCLDHEEWEHREGKCDMSLFKLNSDAQLADDLLLEFLLNLDFIGHIVFEQISHKIVKQT